MTVMASHFFYSFHSLPQFFFFFLKTYTHTHAHIRISMVEAFSREIEKGLENSIRLFLEIHSLAPGFFLFFRFWNEAILNLYVFFFSSFWYSLSLSLRLTSADKHKKYGNSKFTVLEMFWLNFERLKISFITWRGGGVWRKIFEIKLETVVVLVGKGKHLRLIDPHKIELEKHAELLVLLIVWH